MQKLTLTMAVAAAMLVPVLAAAQTTTTSSVTTDLRLPPFPPPPIPPGHGGSPLPLLGAGLPGLALVGVAAMAAWRRRTHRSG